MCSQQIAFYHCGCYSTVKTFRCPTARKKFGIQQCNVKAPIIKANLLNFCTNCAERRKTNEHEIKKIIDKSRKAAEATVKAEAKAEAERQATIAKEKRKSALANVNANANAGVELVEYRARRNNLALLNTPKRSTASPTKFAKFADLVRGFFKKA